MKRYLLWRLADKVPLDPATCLPCNPTDPTLWVGRSAAEAAATLHGHGVALALSDDDNTYCIDIDDALQADGTWSALAVELVQACMGAYVEVSQSGRGLHIIGRGEVPPHSCKCAAHKIELYTEARYIALTGSAAVGSMDHVTPADTLAALVAEYWPPRDQGTDRPDGVASVDDDTILARALAAKSGASVFGGSGVTFRALWEADTNILGKAYPDPSQGREYDASSADAALAQHLAYWCARDPDAIERLMRRSALVRDKWEREDYLPRTISGACARQERIYTAGQPSAVTEAGPDVSFKTGPQILDAAKQLEMMQGCIYITDAHRLLTPRGLLLRPEQVNAIYGGYEWVYTDDGKTTRKAWDAYIGSQLYDAPKVDSLAYRPELPYGVITEGDRTYANSYVDARGTPVEGDVSPILTHVAKLLPDPQDQEVLWSYLAAIVQQPGIKAQWCPVLQGAEGNGKSLLYHAMAYALGERYTHTPNARDLTNPFNSWIEGRLLIWIEELHTGSRQDIADTLKPMITNRRLEIDAKGQYQRTGDNRANLVICSNHRDAVLKTTSDRRYCVLYCAQQSAEDILRDGMDDAYFARLYGWLEGGGAAHVAHYLRHREVTVRVMGRAPTTSSTAAAIESSLTPVEQVLREAIDSDEWGYRQGMVCPQVARTTLQRAGYKVSPQGCVKALMTLGYRRHALGRVRIGNMRRCLYVLDGSIAAGLATVQDLAAAWTAANTDAPQSTEDAARVFSQS